MRPISCPTTRTFEYPSERTAAWTRSAEVFISMPVFGIDESPMPGRSGAMTVNRGASTFASGFHIRDVSAYPWISTAGGPLPPTVTLIVPPSTATDCVLNPGPKSAAYRGAAPTIKARLQSANMDKARRQRKMRDMTDSSGLADRSVVNRLSSPEYLKKSVQSRQRHASHLFEGSAIGAGARGRPHALNRCEKESCERAGVLVRRKLTGSLSPAQHILEDRFDLGLVCLNQVSDLLVIEIALEVRAQQEASSLMVRARLIDDAKQQRRKAIAQGMARGKEALHRRLGRTPVRFERAQVQLTLVADSIVKALAAELH